MVSKVREKILNAAVEQFHVSGFNGSSVQDIVERAEVPKGSFYNYFKSKELLALEVLKVYLADSGNEILESGTGTPVERIRRHFQHMAARYERLGYEKGCLIGNLAAETNDETPMIRDALSQSLSRWTMQLAVVLDEAQGDGQVATGVDTTVLARFLINSWEGALVRMKVAKTAEPLEDFFRIIFDQIVREPAD